MALSRTEILSPAVSRRRYTYRDLLEGRLPSGLYEIVGGEVVRMAPAGFVHGDWEGEVYYRLKQLLGHKGWLAVGEVGLVISKEPLTLRAADIVFLSRERCPERPRGYLEIPPDLVVEIERPGAGDIHAKLRDYFSFGVSRVLVINPEEKTLALYTSEGRVSFHSTEEEVEVLPGVRLSLKDLP
ncbi:Uma2 family endonuclease [Thermosulfurimonas marina]|uniref:Uma2 family endonuclease n=1 Tax=Thermosulfurimonas marina TaxID=2047767 RepID=A0A6H1WSV2_9BACT|nr:Uma2 family endonuclease [Thermosulfurimonas marina]QJA06250.1 Uma2 family endonuclease [Thermosulfurimonas marina]